MTGSESNLQIPSAKKGNIKNLNIQIARNSSTVPSTPSALTFSKERDPTARLGRIKSLGKIDIRSPIITHTTTPGIDNLTFGEESSLYTSRTHNTVASKIKSLMPDALYRIRNYYNDFTTIDWANAFIKTNKFQYELHHKHWLTVSESDNESETVNETKIPFYYRYYLILGRWLLIILIGFTFSIVAYGIDKVEIMLVGFKHGYCTTNWFASQVSCCAINDSDKNYTTSLSPNIFKSGYVFKAKETSETCPSWITWSTYFKYSGWSNTIRFDFLIYVTLTIILAVIACLITLSTKISGRYPVVSPYNKTDDKLADSFDCEGSNGSLSDNIDDFSLDEIDVAESSPNFIEGKTMYTAAGSGVPEVKTILSGFVIRRFLGTYTFIAKTFALVLAIASGMSLGKEGPYVHLATCVGNILSRYFPFVSNNELIQKQILSAAALSGVALAFGSPLGGVLFILEEINHSLPSFQLFQIFFCAIISTLFLKFLDPYGTGNTVLFELNYSSDWNPIELVFFIVIGIAGGMFGALFVKFVSWWPKFFRQLKLIKNRPIFEVVLIALITGLVTFWNPYTKQATTELVLDLATSCSDNELDRSLCPTNGDQFVKELGSLFFALVVKIVLTSITFGLKLPIGIYVPSMVIGALFGRFFGMCIEWLNYTYNLNLVGSDPSMLSSQMNSVMGMVCGKDESCVDLGIYAMISAGAFMAGVTRMNITLVTILFEITSSYAYVLPISISIAVANWMGNLIEPNSLYESLLIANDYPFMSPETEPIDPFKTAGEVVEESVKLDEFSTGTSLILNSPSTTHLPNQPLQASTPAITRNNTFLQQTKSTPVITAADQDINSKMYIDITNSPYVPLSLLKQKLMLLGNKTLLDGCIALLKHKICVGLIFFPELEFCIDKIDEFCYQYDIEEDIYCKLNEEENYFSGSINLEALRNPLKFNLNVVKNMINFQPREVDYFNYGSVEEELENRRLVFELQTELTTLSDFTDYVNFHPIYLNYDSELSFAHMVFDKIGNRVIVLIKDGKYYGVLHKKTLIDFIRREE